MGNAIRVITGSGNNSTASNLVTVDGLVFMKKFRASAIAPSILASSTKRKTWESPQQPLTSSPTQSNNITLQNDDILRPKTKNSRIHIAARHLCEFMSTSCVKDRRLGVCQMSSLVLNSKKYQKTAIATDKSVELVRNRGDTQLLRHSLTGRKEKVEGRSADRLTLSPRSPILPRPPHCPFLSFRQPQRQ